MMSAEPSHRDAIKEFFDEKYYLNQHPELGASNLALIDHFLLQGWKKYWNPSRSFDVSYYLRTNQDVAEAAINPLLHYAWVGRTEGRLPRRPLDPVRSTLEASVSPSGRAKEWGGALAQSPSKTLNEMKPIVDEIATGRNVVISVSHDDYKLNFGGVQRLINDEQIAFCNAGWTYFHFCPAIPLPMLSEQRDAAAFQIKIRLNGDMLCTTTMADFLEALAGVLPRVDRAECIVHHLLGHTPELLVFFVEQLSLKTIFWIHDFFSICTNYSLMRNDVKFCGAPPVGSQGCGICTSGQDRALEAPRMKAFFEATRPIVLAPSQSALDFWTSRSGLTYESASVVPLARIVFADDEKEEEFEEAPRDAKLRVAHIGHRSFFKGWIAFENLALRFANDERYTFFQLGHDNGRTLPGCVKHVSVQVTSSSREAMIEAVAEHRIDVVICWSVWPETFSFVVHEALAGGAFVITSPAAGNVWAAIQKNAPSQGYCLENERMLEEVFASGEIFRRTKNANGRRGALIAGRGTADWVGAKLSLTRFSTAFLREPDYPQGEIVHAHSRRS